MIDWTHWHNEAFLIGGLIFLGWAYALLTGPLRHHVIALGSRPSAPISDLPSPISDLSPPAYPRL